MIDVCRGPVLLGRAFDKCVCVYETVNPVNCRESAMKRTRGRVVRDATSSPVRVLMVAAFVAMLCEPVTAQRSRSGQAQANSKVKIGEFAPDFELPRLTFRTDATGRTVGVISDSDTIRLSSFRGKKPVCMIMSSYT